LVDWQTQGDVNECPCLTTKRNISYFFCQISAGLRTMDDDEFDLEKCCFDWVKTSFIMKIQ
jgi:hypothetical protein